MTQRKRVDRERIREFFAELGKRFRKPARIYLVGGTTLVYEGLRGTTVDIDIVLEVGSDEHANLVGAIRELKDRLSVNVEEASPADFIPLPAGSEMRHRFVGRFERIEVFHFDPYSTALSKIARGQTQDMEDVLELLQAGVLEWERLAGFFNEILPRVGAESLKQDPAEFEATFREVEAMWRARQTGSGE
jgi:hypothetical protein